MQLSSLYFVKFLLTVVLLLQKPAREKINSPHPLLLYIMSLLEYWEFFQIFVKKQNFIESQAQILVTAAMLKELYEAINKNSIFCNLIMFYIKLKRKKILSFAFQLLFIGVWVEGHTFHTIFYFREHFIVIKY